MLVAGGSTNVTTYFAMRLTADGTAATGLTITGFDLQYVRSGVAPVAKVDIASALAATDSAHADNKAIEVDATDQPGLYRVDWPDAAFAAGVRETILTVKVATAFTEHLRVEIDGEVTAEALGTQAKADVNAEADTALTDYDPPTNTEMNARTLVAASYFDPAADAVATVTTVTNQHTLAAIADATWDEAVAGHVTAGSFGKTDADILADTNELQGDDVPGLIATLDAVVDTVKAETALIVADTDVIDDGTSGLVKIASDVAAILVDTGTTLQAELDGIQADTEDIQSRLPAALSGGNMKSDVLAISTSTGAADKQEAAAEVMITGAAEAGTLSTTVMTTDLTEATDDHYNGRSVVWTSGVLIGQASDITDYLGLTGQLTYTAITEAPTAADTFVIV